MEALGSEGNNREINTTSNAANLYETNLVTVQKQIRNPYSFIGFRIIHGKQIIADEAITKLEELMNINR